MTHPALRFFAVLLSLPLLLVAGCQTEPSEPEPEAAPIETVAPNIVEPDPDSEQDPGEAGKTVQIEAENKEWEKIARQLAQGQTLEVQQNIYASYRHHELAIAYRDTGNFDKAIEEARKAVQAWHQNREARSLLNELQQIVTGGREEFGARSIGEREREIWRVRIEQAQVEITKHVRDGERYFNARMFDEAVEEFENAEYKIKVIPYDIKAMVDLLPKVREYVVKSKNARTLEKKAAEELKRRRAEHEHAAHEVATKREIIRKIAYLLELAYMSFDQKRFDRCAKICDEILLVDPHYTVAKELKEDALKTRHKEEYYEVLAKKVEGWKQLTQSDEKAIIPWQALVRYPSRAEWAMISRRIDQKIIRQEGGEEKDPEILAINRKLDTMKIDMAFEGAKLEDILAFIREFTGLNILIDAGIRDQIDLEKAINFKVKDLVLKNALNLLLPQFGIDFQITEEKVILLTTPDRAGGKVVLELHDVRDILVKIQDFPGPRVELVSPQAAGGTGPLTGAMFTLDDAREVSVGEEQIIELIRENIAPGLWDDQYSIERTPNQQLLVSAPPPIHLELREFLGKLRSYTGTMVSVTARFISAYDDFLDDLGVDIINRANAALPGMDYPGTGFTDIDESTGEIGPGFTTHESARLESYDLRAQTFHTLVRFDPLTGIGVDPSSNRLFNQGGLGVQYTWIGEQALQIALRALSKGQRAVLLQAPSLTVFNTQRSHVMFLTQLAYVMDYEPQVSTLAAAYDPIIGILTHGAVLDVRPIVSNDRKYVTMELRPSIAELQQFRQIDIRPGLGIIIQLPWVILQKCDTTVTVPDRGTLMISGFKDIVMKDFHSGVPFLEHIPVLNFFFTRKAKADEKRRLHILVTPEIIDLSEYENDAY